ncbi:ATPase, P-type (transporting), HAD superfamily, subfamily IC [Thiothrix caldifontis]|uniref:ATPase, P-type (Transporting), HAD superfamily, subfamily IC n=1 Tax=Thiothrix caldifontis TaxID=525918 RepID=A0A1H4GZ70_9GAMM|nr:HAD-IC family P-type ATPase [Thiothrix caldifontis]SEB14178.1 ATPase, P-type (transporting), HAD superfamily, subfamily IC [Thiothrix caldifontis]
MLESLREVDTVVFDKTGTLTQEQPTISHIHVLHPTYDETQVLYAAASAEYRQPHPVAKAIWEKAMSQSVNPTNPDNIRYEVGYGISVQLDQQTIRVGSARFMQREGLTIPPQTDTLQQRAETHGHSLIYVGINEDVAGVLEMQPSIRPEVPDLIKTLKQRCITTYIISGDHEQPTRNMAEQLGVDHYFAETLPENKAELINQLREQGKFVCFIGDGINDSIALKSAQVSISLKGASSAAIDTAQIIFMDGTLAPLSRLFAFADEFEHTMRNNLLFSIAPGILNIGGVYLLHFGVAASMGLFYVGTTAGLTNTVLPLIKHQNPAKTTDK